MFSIGVDWLGYLAGTLTTIAIIPEILAVMKAKSASQISYLWLSVILIGLVAWMLYGAILRNIPLIYFNAASAALYVIMIALKAHY